MLHFFLFDSTYYLLLGLEIVWTESNGMGIKSHVKVVKICDFLENFHTLTQKNIIVPYFPDNALWWKYAP
jgi:hypothetical protein